MGDNKKPMANPLAVLREEFDEWAVLFNPENGDAVGINPVGVFIWKCLDGKHTVDHIAAKLEGHFSDVPESVGAEVAAFVDELAGRGFIAYEQKAGKT